MVEMLKVTHRFFVKNAIHILLPMVFQEILQSHFPNLLKAMCSLWLARDANARATEGATNPQSISNHPSPQAGSRPLLFEMNLSKCN
jgi:hypothetical protein